MESDQDEEVSDEDDAIESVGTQKVILASSFKDIIPKVRKICTLMHRSRKANDCLQAYVKAEIGRGKKLKLDTKTRWNRDAIEIDFHNDNCPEFLKLLTRPIQ